jgi:hypothetical protein
MLASFWQPFKAKVDDVNQSVTVREIIDQLDERVLQPIFQVARAHPHHLPHPQPLC